MASAPTADRLEALFTQHAKPAGTAGLTITLHGVAKRDIFGNELGPKIQSRQVPNRAFKFGVEDVPSFRLDLYPNNNAQPLRLEALCASYEVGRASPPFGLHVQRSQSVIEVYDVRAFARIEFISHDAPVTTSLWDEAYSGFTEPSSGNFYDTPQRIRDHADLWSEETTPVARYGLDASTAILGPYMDSVARHPLVDRI